MSEAELLVLIVEDDAGLADLEARRLRRAGLATVAVHDLAHAVEWLQTGSPDLVVIDYHLPDGHAGQLLDWLREQQRDIPVVVVTGRGDEHVAVEMMKWGARDYLVKGSQTLTVLAGVVERVLGQERLRRELRAVQERYQFIVDHTDDMVSILDLDGTPRFISPSVQRLLGYTPEEFLSLGSDAAGGRLPYVVHPDDRERLSKVYRGLRSGGREAMAVEFRLRTRDGRWRWVEAISRAVLDAAGHPIQIITSTRDVSARKAAELQQRTHTELLEALNNLTHQPRDGDVDRDVDGDLLQFLGRMSAIFGFDDARLCLLAGAQPVLRAHAGAGAPPDVERCLAAVVAGGAPLELHGEALQAFAPELGDSPLHSLLALPINGHAGLLGVLCVARREEQPFTAEARRLLGTVVARCALYLENAQLHHRLTASEARYRELVESMPDVVVELDTSGRVTYINRAITGVLGYAPSELLGRPAVEFVAADRATGVPSLQEAFAGGRPLELQAGAVHRDGRIVHVSVQAFARRGADGQVAGLVSIVRDITEQMRLEEQMRSAQRLEAIGRLAGGIAHDFNNLLTGILGSAQILRDQVSADHAFSEDLDLIAAGSQKAAGLTRQLLAFSRRQTMELAPVSLNDVVREVVRLVERIIGTDIAVSLHLDPGVPPCQADFGQLEQVLLNLCVNARDAMPDGGRLRIGTRVAELSPEMLEAAPWVRPGRYVQLSVADTGTGMDRATVARIFEPYFSTKSASGQGTGLGLATVHGIVTQHSGLVHVYSEPGFGSEFKVYLPVSEALSPAVPAAPSPAPATLQGDGRLVLVAEDEAPIRRLVERVLRGAGFQVVLSGNGEEAIEQFNRQPGAFALAVLDAVMPVANGRQAAAVIRTLRPEVPILFMSGFAEEVLSDVVDLQYFLPKPFTRSQLLQMLHIMLGERPVPEAGPARRKR